MENNNNDLEEYLNLDDFFEPGTMTMLVGPNISVREDFIMYKVVNDMIMSIKANKKGVAKEEILKKANRAIFIYSHVTWSIKILDYYYRQLSNKKTNNKKNIDQIFENFLTFLHFEDGQLIGKFIVEELENLLSAQKDCYYRFIIINNLSSSLDSKFTRNYFGKTSIVQKLAIMAKKYNLTVVLLCDMFFRTFDRELTDVIPSNFEGKLEAGGEDGNKAEGKSDVKPLDIKELFGLNEENEVEEVYIPEGEDDDRIINPLDNQFNYSISKGDIMCQFCRNIIFIGEKKINRNNN